MLLKNVTLEFSQDTVCDTKQLSDLRAKDLQTDLKSHRWVGWGPIDGDFDDVFGDTSTISPL